MRQRPAPGGSFVLDVDAVAAFAGVEEGCARRPARHRVLCTWVRHFTPAAPAAELTAAGLTLREAYGDLAGAPYAPDGPHFAVVAGRG